MKRYAQLFKGINVLFRNFQRYAISIFAGIFLTLNLTVSFASENTSIRIAMATSPLSAPFIIAQEKGYFKELGLAVNISQVKGGHLAYQALASGEADIATSSEAVVMFNSFKHDDFSIFCTFVNSDNDVKILAHRDSGIKTIQDLKGKKVATIVGTSAHFFLNHTLLMKGIAESELKISGFKPQQATEVLKNKEFDAVVTWEPYAYLAQKALGDDGVLIRHDRVYIETFNALTKREFASKNPELLEKVTQALIKATNFINSKPKETQVLVAKKLNKELDVIQSTWSDFSFEVRLDQWLLASMEAEARWAMEHNFLKKNDIPNYLNYINVEPLKKVAPTKLSILK